MLRHTVFAALGAGDRRARACCRSSAIPLAGLGACIGLGLGPGEHPPRDVDRLEAERLGPDQDQAPMAMNTLMRLALTTVVAIVLVVVNLPLGMGVLGGVAVFYFLFVVNLIVTLLRQGAVT